MREAAVKIDRSFGWLSDAENNSPRIKLDHAEFNRIIHLLDGDQFRSLFKNWVSSVVRADNNKINFDGAIVKHIRIKKNLPLSKAALAIEISTRHLSNVENGHRNVTSELRDKILRAYGYSPSSIKNFLKKKDKNTLHSVPTDFKLAILLPRLSHDQKLEVFNFTQKIIQKNETEPKGEKNGQ